MQPLGRLLQLGLGCAALGSAARTGQHGWRGKQEAVAVERQRRLRALAWLALLLGGRLGFVGFALRSLGGGNGREGRSQGGQRLLGGGRVGFGSAFGHRGRYGWLALAELARDGGGGRSVERGHGIGDLVLVVEAVAGAIVEGHALPFRHGSAGQWGEGGGDGRAFLERGILGLARSIGRAVGVEGHEPWHWSREGHRERRRAIGSGRQGRPGHGGHHRRHGRRRAAIDRLCLGHGLLHGGQRLGRKLAHGVRRLRGFRLFAMAPPTLGEQAQGLVARQGHVGGHVLAGAGRRRAVDAAPSDAPEGGRPGGQALGHARLALGPQPRDEVRHREADDYGAHHHDAHQQHARYDLAEQRYAAPGYAGAYVAAMAHEGRLAEQQRRILHAERGRGREQRDERKQRHEYDAQAYGHAHRHALAVEPHEEAHAHGHQEQRQDVGAHAEHQVEPVRCSRGDHRPVACGQHGAQQQHHGRHDERHAHDVAARVRVEHAAVVLRLGPRPPARGALRLLRLCGCAPLPARGPFGHRGRLRLSLALRHGFRPPARSR